MAATREQLDAYVKGKSRIEPESLPFAHEGCEVSRHMDSGPARAIKVMQWA